MQKQGGGTPGTFNHINEVSDYLSRQGGGGGAGVTD